MKKWKVSQNSKSRIMVGDWIADKLTHGKTFWEVYTWQNFLYKMSLNY